MYTQTVETRISVTLLSAAAGGSVVVDVCPANQYCAAVYNFNGPPTAGAYLTPDNLPSVASAIANCVDVNYYRFVQMDQLFATALQNPSGLIPLVEVPSMRCSGMCVEVTNLNALSAVGGAMRALRYEAPPGDPITPSTLAALPIMTNLVGEVLQAGNTQHAGLVSSLRGVCVANLPLDLPAGNLIQPASIVTTGQVSGIFWAATSPGLRSAGAGYWANTAYGTGTVGDANSPAYPWSMTRLVFDSASASTTLDIVVRARYDLLVPPLSFLSGGARAMPLGDFLPVLREARAMRSKEPFMSITSGLSRDPMPYVGVMGGEMKPQASKQRKGKAKPSTTRPRTTTTTTSQAPRAQQQQRQGRSGPRVQAVVDTAAQALNAIMNTMARRGHTQQQALADGGRRRRR